MGSEPTRHGDPAADSGTSALLGWRRLRSVDSSIRGVYARSVRIPDDKLPDALLALLDDAAFRAYDLLGLDEGVVRDFKQLTTALSKRFAPSTGQQELRFLLGQRQQEAGETLDDFADALIHLANQSYPTLEPKLRMELARDRFVAGVRSEHVQEALLKTPPETLDHARETAKRIEAAQAARKIMRPKRSDVLAVTTAETQDEGKLTESADYVEQRVAAVAEQRQEDSLIWKQFAVTRRCWSGCWAR